MDEETLVKRRILDLAKRAWQRNIYLYTNFLSPAEQDILFRMGRELDFVSWECFGGNEACERRMAGFGSEEETGYPRVFPIRLLEICPVAEKFAEPLTHRDYLGALLNLGIVRGLLGDIVVRPKRAYVYCSDGIADFIRENLTRVRHTLVNVREVPLTLEDVKPVRETRKENVASERLDVIAAAVCGCSRSRILEIFREKKVFVNGRVEEDHSRILKEGDVFSVRGTGKFIYEGIRSETKKGRYTVTLQEYV
ncbi:MAG: hypothetical protein HFI93_05810 [Lachnospiraceae bacterium]|nr:hypothetical protein [Lachnospiraceae bacterium]